MSLFAFLVMPRKASGCRIHYGRRPEFEAKEEKLTFLHNTDLNARRWISRRKMPTGDIAVAANSCAIITPE
jgi:hypothetical protein